MKMNKRTIKLVKLLKEYVILEKLKDEVEILPATKQDVAEFVKKHYLHQFPTGTKRIYAIYQKQQGIYYRDRTCSDGSVGVYDLFQRSGVRCLT